GIGNIQWGLRYGAIKRSSAKLMSSTHFSESAMYFNRFRDLGLQPQTWMLEILNYSHALARPFALRFRSNFAALGISRDYPGVGRLRSSSGMSSTLTFPPLCVPAMPSVIMFKQNGQAVASAS